MLEAGRWFVEEEQLWRSNDSERDVDAALLTAGETPDPLVGLRGEADEGEGLVNAARCREEAREE